MSFPGKYRGCPSDVAIASIESSNATKSDLPGHGRIIGNAISSLGKWVELRLNGLAERRGLGPDLLTLAIINRENELQLRRHMIEGESVDFMKEDIKQHEDVKKLIRYTGSKTEITRKQALENITDLAWQSERILEMLRELKTAQFIKEQEPFIWDFCDMSLQVYSRTAIACIEEGRFSRLVKSCGVAEKINENSEALVSFMQQNPDEMFLVLRTFARFSRRMFFDGIENILGNLEEYLEASSELIEWEEVDKLFTVWFSRVIKQRQFSDQSKDLLNRMCRSGEKLPQTLSSRSFQDWLLSLRKPQDHYTHYLLASISDSEGVFSPVHWYIQDFMNPCDFALCQAALQWLPGIFARLPPSHEKMVGACRDLARCLDSGTRALKERAVLCIQVILSHDVYSRKLMLDALSRTSFARSRYHTQLVALTMLRCATVANPSSYIYFSRHCDEQGFVVHVGSGSVCTASCAVEYQLECTLEDIMYIEFLRGMPIRVPDMVMPLLAGHYQDGRHAFLGFACTDGESNARDMTEGMRAEDFNAHGSDDKFTITDKIQLIVLRYPPESYETSKATADDPEDSLDATGPFGWRYSRVLSRVEQFRGSEKGILCKIPEQ